MERGSSGGRNYLYVVRELFSFSSGDQIPSDRAGAPGDVLAYRIYLDNTSSETVSNLTIHDRTPPYTVLGAAPTSPSAVASQLNCLLVVPASAAPGYAGVLQWDCSGMLPPGDSGFVNFEVRILD